MRLILRNQRRMWAKLIRRLERLLIQEVIGMTKHWLYGDTPPSLNQMKQMEDILRHRIVFFSQSIAQLPERRQRYFMYIVTQRINRVVGDCIEESEGELNSPDRRVLPGARRPASKTRVRLHLTR